MWPATAERHVRVLCAADVESERVLEDLFVAVGRAQHRHHPIALRDRDAVHLHVDLRAARPEGDGRRPAQHLFDRAGAYRLVGAVPLDLLGVRHERLQSRRKCVLRGVTARERQHEEEDLELVGWEGQLFTVLVGDHRGSERAPDVIHRIAPLLRGELERVREDPAEQLQRFLLAHPRPRGVRLQDAVERFEDLRTILFGYADDVADDRHWQHIGDIVDPIAATRGKQPVDHRGGA